MKEPKQKSKIRILVVEDEIVVSEDLQQRLTLMDYEVVGAADTGADAIAQAKSMNPDIVLMDIMLHGKPEGISAAEIVRDELDIPVIYLTAHSDSTTLKQARLTDPVGYIVKPFEEDQLRVALHLAPAQHKMRKTTRQLQKKTRVIVVEDEIIVAEDLQQRLRHMGFEVIGSTDNMADAVALSKAEKPDIVLMDVMLHGKPEGIAAAEVIREQLDLPVIFLTAQTDWATLQKAKLIDPAGYVTKPFEDEQLRSVLDLAPEHHKLRQQAQQNKRRIMIVEDQAVVAEDVREKLIILDYEVVGITDNAVDAISMARTLCPDVVLMDIKLHGNMDGIAVAAVLRWELQTPVIYLTSHSDTQTLQRAKSTDPVAYLVQPFNDEQMRVALELSPTRQEFEEQVLQEQNAEEIRLAAVAFNSNEAMMITDANAVILRVNPAFTEVLGYHSEEIVGQSASVLKSTLHNQSFYSELWSELESTGSWQGEIMNRRKQGEFFPCWVSIRAMHEGHERIITRYICILTDITSRKIVEEEIKHLAFYDPLTGLANRRLLAERLHYAQVSSRRSKCVGAVMLIDMDHFKMLNDSKGHEMGDLLLQQVAQRLLKCVRENDTVARLGGDEFVVLLQDLSSDLTAASTQADAVGQKIRAALNHPYDLMGFLHHSTPSIGVTLYGESDQVTVSTGDLLQQADLAMYQAKSSGRNTLKFFDSVLQNAVTDRFALLEELAEAVRKNELVLYYQPQVNMTGQVMGVEALVRWLHPQRGLTAPCEFITLAEETGLILPLGHWVLETACAQLASWSAQVDTAHLTMAVNVSVMQFNDPDFVEQVLDVLARTGAEPSKLKLEITESLLMHEVENIISKITVLKEHGVTFALDDFGTGYSSLRYLQLLPLDQLKIDLSFVRDVLIDESAAAIVKTIVALAHGLSLRVIAEGVETEGQRQFLADHQCLTFQGFLFSRPLALSELEEYIKQSPKPIALDKHD